MANETRVNLLHLLEDIRDSYALPIEEVIVTELVANALDSGASSIDFFVDKEKMILRCVDSGRGMTRRELRDYHNIAATTKIRGKGIGFAGVGAKLSLLVASRVVTETRGPHGSRGATEWHLASPLRAPWRFLTFSGLLEVPRGTSVSVELLEKSSPLLDSEFITRTLQKHFLPLFDPNLFQELFRFIYKKDIAFYVNDIIVSGGGFIIGNRFPFKVFLGKSSRRPVGVGYLWKLDKAPETGGEPFGMAISTYGKIIKRGWEWLGVMPKSYRNLCGVIEIPGLAELLTTNKTDFLNDATSLKKYYRYRKAIQEKVISILQSWDEVPKEVNIESSQRLKSLQREIEGTLNSLVPRFPELSALIGTRLRSISGKVIATAEGGIESKTDYLTGVASLDEGAGGVKSVVAQKQSPSSNISSDTSGDIKKKAKSSGLRIVFEEFGDETVIPSLGRMVEDTIYINTQHRAWQKAKKEGVEEYHVLLSVVWVLSQFLEEDRSPYEFVSDFLSYWGKFERGTTRLF